MAMIKRHSTLSFLKLLVAYRTETMLGFNHLIVFLWSYVVFLFKSSTPLDLLQLIWIILIPEFRSLVTSLSTFESFSLSQHDFPIFPIILSLCL